MRLDIRNLSFRYKKDPILSNVSFSLPAGAILAVIGKNGAGKSTLLKSIGNILTPSSGSIRVDGKDVLSMNREEVAACFAYVPQAGEGTSLDVFTTVLLGRKPHIRFHPDKNDLIQVEELLETLDLSHLAMRPTATLSGGELQKVSIARALVQQAAVLLMDEPTSSLDIGNQLDLIEILCRTVKITGVSIVVTVHDINLALRFADWFLLIDGGRIVDFTPKEGITPDMIQQTYGVTVTMHHMENHTIVIPSQNNSR